MKRLLLSASAIILVVAASATLRDEIAASPGKSGGIYYAYPVTEDVAPDAPKGYSPVYISHYGRHGSRWLIKEWEYSMTLAALKEQRKQHNLTPFGGKVESMVTALWNDADGNYGALTPLGERQHRGIADRLYRRYPTMFADSATIDVYSSTEPRCIVSMAAFCERLKEKNPVLRIKRKVSPGNMDFIAYSTPEAKAWGADTASWRKDYHHWRDSIVNPRRVMSLIFNDPSKVDKHHFFIRMLHDIAVGEQNVAVKTGLIDIFTDDELYALWQELNYNMYVKHACATISRNVGPESASSLLRHFIDEADRQLSSGKRGVTLRFGHDTNLIRLLALMKIDGCAVSESDPDRYCLAWQDFNVSPMGANLQLIFFRDNEGKTITLIRHNEHPVTVPLKPVKGTKYFYDWYELRAFWSNLK